MQLSNDKMEQETNNQQAPSELEDVILQAALRLFAEKGYFNTSLNDIVEAAGVKTTSTLYQHFKNKQLIASALNEKIFDSLSVSIDDIRRRSQKASEQLRGIVDLLFGLADEAPEVIGFLIILHTDEFLPEPKKLMQSAPFAKIIKIFQAGIKAGEIRNIDPVLAYAYFFGIINNTLRLVLTAELAKQADVYLAGAWLAAWGAIAKK